jgi:hypothetical protein
MQREGKRASPGVVDCDSGLQHHRQCNGQPCMKTSVLMPLPSWIAYRWISKIKPWGTFTGISPAPLGWFPVCPRIGQHG